MSTVKVKVKVSVLISHLEKALAEREARYENQEKEQAKYEKAVENYNLAVLKLIKSGKGTINEAERFRGYHPEKRKGKVAFTATIWLDEGSLPDEPKRPDCYPDYHYKTECEEITQAIRVLKLTDEQYVSASTYASVAKYL